jgi:hypothetical protein
MPAVNAGLCEDREVLVIWYGTLYSQFVNMVVVTL